METTDKYTLGEIRRVFQSEISTLKTVEDAIDESYARAINLILQSSGKIIVTGMGKSGLIANKIAATLVSTGTVAVSLHPADAMHGDVGVIQEGDVVLAISKSGETDELLSILPYLREAKVPLISITTNLSSTLANNSCLVLYTPVAEEACPLDLAPTSTTTAALVVGDAIALTLMTIRGFTSEDFARVHPGGILGKRLLMTVSDVMRSGDDNPVINVNDSVKQMLLDITAKRCGAVSIINDHGKLLGLITDNDIRKNIDKDIDIFSLTISDIMNSNPTHIYSHEKAISALNIMENRDNPFLLLPVLEAATDKVVGMVHLHDLVAQAL